MNLTKRQKEVLDFIKSFQRYNGYTPSIHEIRVHLGLSSPATVHKHLVGLEERGAIRRKRYTNRYIEVL